MICFAIDFQRCHLTPSHKKSTVYMIFLAYPLASEQQSLCQDNIGRVIHLLDHGPVSESMLL